jgi:soluble lytic murein transglycosylase-like protein
VRVVVFLCLAAVSAAAGEYAVLQSGFRMHADRHEIIGEKTRLYSASGAVELESAQISHFEQEEYVKPAPAPAPPPEAAVTPPAEQPKTPQQLVDEAAERHGLRPEFVRSVALAESAFKANAVSHKGAIGLMQLMPGTAADLGVNPLKPEENVEGGTRYLKELLLKYKDKPDGVRLALAAYNAGPGAVDRYRSIPPYRETQAYVDKVIRQYLKELN